MVSGSSYIRNIDMIKIQQRKRFKGKYECNNNGHTPHSRFVLGKAFHLGPKQLYHNDYNKNMWKMLKFLPS